MPSTPKQTAQQEIPYGYCHCGCGELSPIAKRTYTGQGIFKGKPVRYISGHNARKFSGDDYEVDSNGCWVWRKGVSPAGYGRINIKSRSVYAHRYYYEQKNVAIPEGKELDHLCRNRRCVNPDHLQPVSGAENTRRGSATKISKEDVEEIRRAHANGEPQRRLAKTFNLSSSHVCRIVNFIKWRS